MMSINNSNEIEDLQKFWNTCDTTFAHLTINKHLKNYSYLTKNWDECFLTHLNNKYDLKNKIVIDYGIGGAYLGLYLYHKYNICKYIGIDISERQMMYAQQNLIHFNVIHELILMPIEFKILPADIFISQATIQHFPSIKYFKNFLNNLNESHIPVIMLQIRYGVNTTFTNGKYISIKEVVHRCHTNEEYISASLPNYKICMQGPILHNKYQFLIYEYQN